MPLRQLAKQLIASNFRSPSAQSEIILSHLSQRSRIPVAAKLFQGTGNIYSNIEFQPWHFVSFKSLKTFVELGKGLECQIGRMEDTVASPST